MGRSEKIRLKNFNLRKKLTLMLCFLACIVWYFSLPKKLFEAPLSCVVKDSDGNLLGAQIADDGQWRFPFSEDLPETFSSSIIYFEDEYFYKHPGFNPVSIAKAFSSNISSESRRGGSTITQQVIRLSRKNKQRSYAEKFIELIQATRLELRFSKDEILQLYANHAPFGGNVVGLESASWRYYGIQPSDLTWGQATALAVLPNAPSLIYPGKNEEILLQKRNRLLQKLLTHKIIDEETYQLSLLEALPSKAYPIPNHAFHWTDWICKKEGKTLIKSSISGSLQQNANQIVNERHTRLSQNNIQNLSLLVVENKSRKVLAYVGNHQELSTPFRYIDMVQAKRSTGSTLKPFLYAKAIENGSLFPRSLLQDIPIGYRGYRPKNFNEQFYGIVPANEALSRSLNVPFVNLLYQYGVPSFQKDLQSLGISQLNRPPSYYGLSLILGGAEVNLWEMTQAYVNFASIYFDYISHSGQYRKQPILSLHHFNEPNLIQEDLQFSPTLFNASSVYFSLKAMTQVQRPEAFDVNELLDQSNQIAWKTGTSFGFKDAWSIGINTTHTVAVWVGNADTEGRPNLTGVRAAAPIMFEMFNQLPRQKDWLQPPYDDLIEEEICDFSGTKATANCESSTKDFVPAHQKNKRSCSRCVSLDVDSEKQFQVTRNCYPQEKIRQHNYVLLSPVEAFYASSSKYSLPPAFHPECVVEEQNTPMEFIFPRKGEVVFLPKGFDESLQEIVLHVAHLDENEEVFWYLNDNYLNSTNGIHELSIPLQKGKYFLSVVDTKGNFLHQRINVETQAKN